ncbi:MAG: DUF3047 domain-containing protein [Candidatus Omnitrophota bacterium]
MKVKRIIFISLAILGALSILAYSAAQQLKYFTFNEVGALSKWEKMILNKEVEYVLAKIGNDGHVQALSDKACSALYHKVKYKLEDYPYLSWKWKALKFPDLSKATTEEERDDYTARVYVIFPSWIFTSYRFIEYVWSDTIPADTIHESPFGKNIKVIVIRSGKPEGEEWVSQVRNVYEDYKKAFDKEASRTVGAIALMCDADGTKTSAESLFDDIAISKYK